MNIYDELNDLNTETSTYEEGPLPEKEREDWEKRVRTKLLSSGSSRPSRARRRAKWLIPSAVALLLAIGATLPSGQEALARLPFVAGLIERFAGDGPNADYSAYKTQEEQTAINEFGSLTLKEVIVDTDQLLIALKFKPAEGIEVGEGLQMTAKVLINGENVSMGGGSYGSEKEQDGTYTLYEDASLSELPPGETLHVSLEYSGFYPKGFLSVPTNVTKPWKFEVESSRAAILADTKTVRMGRKVLLTNGQQILIEKVVVSPLSTRVFMKMTKEAEPGRKYTFYGFRLVSASGKEFDQSAFAGGMDSYSYSRFPKIDLEAEKYFLIPYDGSQDKELGEAIPIEP
ncbi:hypothetical protein CDO73_18225 [Saccharibacillus sp. O23]|uniref:DUF4179 domain-containing protein n=1 Tax=Saccharibacillus sp. O23 TaxID=2009338 RepID=UPI000B4E4D89|nr:DUF4179 domain-containing protein [Saccharibacillus sp. O23]OWR28487.1 hypothetical protein CDO73_18225 [Saccharibacillus sp. O23]